MADFEEDGAANLASKNSLNDDHISSDHDLITQEPDNSTDRISQLDPFSLASYSAMAETDPIRFQDENIKESDFHEGGDAIAGGYTYYDHTDDDLPANFARAQQSQVHGDEASEEHYNSGSNPFADDGEKDTGVSSCGYVDDRPIIGYNPFLNEDERCRADGQEVAEPLDNKENEVCQQYKARDDVQSERDHEQEKEQEIDQYQKDNEDEQESEQHYKNEGKESEQYYRDDSQENDQYCRETTQESDEYYKDEGQDNEQYYKDEGQDSEQYHIDEEQDSEQYHKDEEQDSEQYHKDEEQDSEQYYKDEEQDSEQYHKDEEQDSEQYHKDEEQDSEQYHKDEEQDSEQYHKDEGQDSEQYHKDEEQDSEQYYKDEGQDSEQYYQDEGKDLKDHKEDNLLRHEQTEERKQDISDYERLEDLDGADLEMDPVDNIQDAESEYRGKFESVGCNLFGDGPIQSDDQGQTESIGTDTKYEIDAKEPPKAISCSMFGDELLEEENKQSARTDQDMLEETYPSEPALGDKDEDKQYAYNDGDKIPADEQYEDDQEQKEYEEYGHDHKEQEIIPQKERSNEDLGIVNQAFTDDVDIEDKQVEDVDHEDISSEECEIKSELGKNNIKDEDGHFVSSTVQDLEYSQRNEVIVDNEEKIHDEADEDYQEEIGEKGENILDYDNVIKSEKTEIRDLGFEQQFKENDMFTSQHGDRNYVDNLSELTSPDTVPQPLPSPPEPKDMSPFDPNAPSDSLSPCQENLGQHGDTADDNNTGDFLSAEVEGETKFGVDGTAVTSTNTHNGTFIHSEDEEEEETEEESQQLDQGCITATGTTETETSIDDRSGEYVGHDMETNDNALMSMSMEGSFYDDGGELIGGEDRRAQQNHLYHDEDRYVEQNVELNQQIQNCYSQPSHDSFGLQDVYTHNALDTHDVISAVNGDADSLLDAPVTAQGLQTPVTEHENVVDSSVDVTETEEYQSNVDASHLVEDSVESDAPGESIDAVGISSPPDEQIHEQKELEEALGSIHISEPAPEKAEEPSSSVDDIVPGSKSEEALAAAAAPAAVTGVAAAAAAASVSSTKTVKKTTSSKTGSKTTTTTSTKTAKEIKTTDGKPASAKKIETTTTTVTKTSKKTIDTRPTSATTTEKKSSAKPTTTSPTKSSTPAAPKPSGAAPSYAQPITPRKPREATVVSSEEKKKTPRTPSATARTPKTQSATSTTTSTSSVTKTTARTTSAVSSTTTSRTAQLARPKSSPTKLTNGTTAPHSTMDTNKSPTKKSETKPSSGTVRVTSEKKEIKAALKVEAGTKTSTSTSTAKSPTKPSTPRIPSATTPKAGEVKEVKEVKSKIGSLDKTTHTPGGGNVKITSKKTDFTNVTSKIGSKDKMDHKPGGGNIRIENKKLKIEAKSKIGSLDNASHKPSGGDKKIESKKLEWKVESKIGSLENAKHVAGGGDKKIEFKKIEWSAKSKVGSLDNAAHVPGGGDKKILSEKLDWKASSHVGSLDNVKHEPGGGNVKIESRKLDFKEKASPKIGSLDSKKASSEGATTEVPTTNGVTSGN